MRPSLLPSPLPSPRRLHGERGAVAVLTAILLAGVLAAGLWGTNAATMLAVHREVGRAAGLSALAGAAALPLVGVLSSGEPETTACGEAAALLGDGNGAPLTRSLAVSGAPSCGVGVTVEGLAETPLAESVRSALAGLLAGAGLDAPDVCDPLVAPTLDPWLATLAATECDSLAGALEGLPDRLSPAVLTPRVRVTVAGEVEAPLPLPGFTGARTVSADALARRRFKNVVVLPPVRLDPLTGVYEAVLGDAGGGVPMPLDEVNPNPEAAAVRDRLLPMLREADAALAAHVNPLLPPGYRFGLDGLIRDVADVFDPPVTRTPPSPLDVAAEAARTGDPVVLLRLFSMPVLGIPALDFTAVYLTPLAGGGFEATPVPVEQLTAASGLFGAALVRDGS